MIFLILCFIAFSGCAATKLSKKSDADISLPPNQKLSVGVVNTIDERASEKIGVIDSAAIIVKKSDLTDLVGDRLIRYINEKVGLDVVRVQLNETDSIKLITTKKKMKGVIILKIKSLRIFAADALAHLIEAEMILELTVLDEVGQKIYQRTASGQHKQQAITPITEETTKVIVESVTKTALRQYSEDSDLKKIIAKFKYGAIGGVITSIF